MWLAIVLALLAIGEVYLNIKSRKDSPFSKFVLNMDLIICLSFWAFMAYILLGEKVVGL